MNREDVIRMAQEADLWLTSPERIEAVKRFAALVAAAERNRIWTQAHWTEYERSIVAAEREACAKVCEQAGIEGYGTLAAAAMIRARGEK